jgi:TPR repeat protein
MKTVFAALLFMLLVPASSFAQQESFPDMLRLARQGKAWAQNEVGIMYSLGEGVRRDPRKAVYWLRKSANQGFPLGACSLGYHYGNGRGVKRNYVLMLKWVFIGEALDALRCGSEGAKQFKPSKCQIGKGWELAAAWLRARRELKNNFGEQPWLKASGSEAKNREKQCNGKAR